MGKKNKKEKKGKGAEKTALKTEKNAEKKAKKSLHQKGEDDVESLIAEFQEKDRKLTQVTEEKCPPPSPRCNMTLTPHPDKDELIMFGGEYFNGSQTFLYNDLFVYYIKSNTWSQIRAPNTPPPRCAHQAVSLKQSGGQLWLFGGEFASPTQSQFHHYKDLWLFHLQSRSWEQVKAPNGPSSRSGHRMAVCKKNIIVFGGFHDNIRDYKYFNDLHTFNVDTYMWTKVEPLGMPPQPRSACQMAVSADGNRVFVYGGYSKERLKKDLDRGIIHSDLYVLTPEGKSKDNAEVVPKWKWMPLKQSGLKPSPRCAFSLATIPGNRAVLFGGVFDEEEDDDDVVGIFYNELYVLDYDTGKWHTLTLRGNKDIKEKKRRRKTKQNKESDDDNDDELVEVTQRDIQELQIDSVAQMDIEQLDSDVAAQNNSEDTLVVDDGVFKVTVGGAQSASVADDIFNVRKDSGGGGDNLESGDGFQPCKRMNALMAVKSGKLYLYGGMFEIGERQVTLSDMYVFDAHKLDEWQTLIENTAETQEWLESDSSSDESEEMEGAVGVDEGHAEEEDMEEDPPTVQSDEDLKEYFGRTKDYWLQEADDLAEQKGETLPGKQLRKDALRMAELFHRQSKS